LTLLLAAAAAAAAAVVAAAVVVAGVLVLRVGWGCRRGGMTTGDLFTAAASSFDFSILG
jgi:hypothetical protein